MAGEGRGTRPATSKAYKGGFGIAGGGKLLIIGEGSLVTPERRPGCLMRRSAASTEDAVMTREVKQSLWNKAMQDGKYGEGTIAHVLRVQ